MTDNGKPAEAGGAPEGEKQYTPEESLAEIKRLRSEAKTRRLQAEALAAEIEERKRADEQREQDWLKEQGDFKSLYEKQQADLTQAKTEAQTKAAYEEAFKKSLDARIAAIPEGMRSLVPDGLEPLKLSEWLDKNATLLTKRTAPNLDAGAGSGSSGKTGTETPSLSAEEIRMAEMMRISPEAYAKQKAEIAALRGRNTSLTNQMKE